MWSFPWRNGGEDMKTFYVNVVYNDNLINRRLPYPQTIIGLFGDHKWNGRGNFCGWYSAEYFLNTDLYAYYVADCPGFLTPEKRLSEVVVCNPPIHYSEVQIGSCYWTREIKAETLEEAIKIFESTDWCKQRR